MRLCFGRFRDLVQRRALAGAQCPGLNAVIRAIVQRIVSEGGSCVGILEGWRGLIQGMSRNLEPAEMAQPTQSGRPSSICQRR